MALVESSELSCKELSFAQGRQVSRMTNYANAELAGIHLAYGAADCNGRAAQRLYEERYPMRRILRKFLGKPAPEVI